MNSERSHRGSTTGAGIARWTIAALALTLVVAPASAQARAGERVTRTRTPAADVRRPPAESPPPVVTDRMRSPRPAPIDEGCTLAIEITDGTGKLVSDAIILIEDVDGALVTALPDRDGSYDAKRVATETVLELIHPAHGLATTRMRLPESSRTQRVEITWKAGIARARIVGDTSAVGGSAASPPRLGTCPPAGSGDEPNDALVAVTGINPGDTTGNTGTLDDTSCGLNDGIDEWWCWEADCTGVATIGTCNFGGSATFDTVVAVFDGTGVVELACDDDVPGCSLRSEVQLAVTSGVTYLIRVSGFSSAFGTYDLAIDCAAGSGCVPDFNVTAPGVFTGTTVGAGNDCALRPSEDVQYEVIVPTGALWRLSLAGSSFDTFLSVGTTCCGDEVGSDDDGGPGTTSELSANLAAGTYHVTIESYFTGSTGDYVLTIEQVAPSCVVSCPPDGIDEIEPDCGLPFDTVNGGCNSVPPVFLPISCGQTICGTAAFDGSTRDTDWYEIEITAQTTLTVEVEAEFIPLVGIVDLSGGCPNPPTLVLEIVPAGCGAVSALVGPGPYAIFIAPDFGSGTVACPTAYTLTLTADNDACSPPGGCCLPDGTCEELAEQDCLNAGGSFNGEGTDCSGAPEIPTCVGSTEDAVIAVRITTDSFSGETSWQIEEQATGIVVAGDTAGSDNSIHMWFLDVCSTSCYDFTIFDSFGDGIDPPGGYEVLYEGVPVGSGGDFTFRDTVTNIGDGCIIDPRACVAGAEDTFLELMLFTDNFGGETTWELVETITGDLIAAGGPYVNNVLLTVTVPVCSTSCYEFTIFDSMGDGICCLYGNGIYELTFDGVEIRTGGEFGLSETTEFGFGCGLRPFNGACCFPDDCVDTTMQCCEEAGGVFLGIGTECGVDDCPPLGACCLDDDTCIQTFEVLCDATPGAEYLGDDEDCIFTLPGEGFVDEADAEIPFASGGTEGELLRTINVSGSFIILDLDVDVTVEGNNGDADHLEISLEHNGVEVGLWEDDGSSGDMCVIFDDEGEPLDSSNEDPTVGRIMLPTGDLLAEYDARDGQGDWTLTIRNDRLGSNDPPVLKQWSLHFNSCSPCGPDCQPNDIPDECETLPEGTAGPARDVCGEALHVCPGLFYFGDNEGATSDVGSGLPCGVKSGWLDVWYRYRPSMNGSLFIQIFGMPANGFTVDPVMSVHTACPEEAIDLETTLIDCNHFNPYGVEFPVTMGEDYWIRIAGNGSTEGTFRVLLLGPDCALSPNDVNNNDIPDDCEMMGPGD